MIFFKCFNLVDVVDITVFMFLINVNQCDHNKACNMKTVAKVTSRIGKAVAK